MGLFSCQPELLIQSGFFLSLFLSIFFFFLVDFILGNGKVTGWHGWPSPGLQLRRSRKRSRALPQGSEELLPALGSARGFICAAGAAPGSAPPAGRSPGVPCAPVPCNG